MSTADLLSPATVVAEAPVCRRCRGPLEGRQTAFCSKACNAAWWDAQHPRVNWTDQGAREGKLIDSILGFLLAHPGEWFTAHQIAEAVRGFPHSVSARLSELRRRGHAIETDARNGNSKRAHRYRLVA